MPNNAAKVMDKRVHRTKQTLRTTLFDLLKTKPIEDIRTTEICEKSLVARNTFYSYYADKYDLLEDCFKQMEKQMYERYYELQCKNNPNNEPTALFLNIVDVLLENDERYKDIFQVSSIDSSEMYYQFILDCMKKYETHLGKMVNPHYDMDQLNSFLALGFWGFIHGNRKLTHDQIRDNTRRLATDLLKSPIFDNHNY